MTQPAANAMERIAASQGFDGPSIHSASAAQAMPIRANGHASAFDQTSRQVLVLVTASS